MTDRGSLEILANEAVDELRAAAQKLKRVMPNGVGFAVLVFDCGDKGNLAYVSNAERADMLQAMREFIAKVERGSVSSVFGGPRT